MPMMASFGQFWYPIGASREHVSFIICRHGAIKIMPPTTSQKEPNTKWDKADDAKLRELIAQGIDPTDLSLQNIK
jgi:hypothetical protein